MAINNDGITFNMTEHIDMLNEKTVGGGGYAIPKEYIVQKYLKERINPEIPTATILAALDTRIFEDKAMASAQALMGGPQKSVLEETITETETAMAPRMPQGINQGQPSPMPGQMPRQMAGLQRPPMPGRVPPQRNNGIPMMAAAGGYVPNFADGGIIGYKELGYVKNRFDPDAKPFTERKFSFSDIISDSMAAEGGYDGPSSYERKAIEEIKKLQGERGEEFPTLIGGRPEDIARESIFDEIKQREKIKTDLEGGGGYNPIVNEQTEIDDNILAQTKENIKMQENIDAQILANKKPDDIKKPVDIKGSGIGNKEDNLFQGAYLDTGVIDTSVYEEVDIITAGNEAAQAYEDRIGVSPFVALAGKYEQEIGENIAEAKKQSIGKMLYNFGSELTKSGKLGDAAVAAGRDIDKDMDRLITLRREQRKIGFDIAKIGEAERQTKGKIGADAEGRAKLTNEKRRLQKNTDMLKQKEMNIKAPYYKALSEKALAEGRYYDKFDSAKTGAIKEREAQYARAFGSPAAYENFLKNYNTALSAAERNGTSIETEITSGEFGFYPEEFKNTIRNGIRTLERVKASPIGTELGVPTGTKAPPGPNPKGVYQPSEAENSLLNTYK